MKKFINILLLLISTAIYSMPPSSETTINGGNWTTNGNWFDGSSPSTTGGSNIIYNINHTMTLSTVGFTLGSNSVLNICNTCTLTINGDVTFSNGSTINLPTGGVLIINGNVINNNNSNQIYIDGTIVINGNFTGGNGSTVTSPSGTGSMDISGSVTTSGTGVVFGSNVDCVSNCDNSNTNPLGSSLPIELIIFNGRPDGFDTILEWITATETNNDYFEIERSEDGINWEYVKQIDGEGNSVSLKKYSFVDTNPNIPISYYRLKQVDFDGKYSFSNIIYVDFVILERKKHITPTPNPIVKNEDISLIISGFLGDEILLILTDVYGKSHYQKVFMIYDNKTTVVIPNGNLPQGTYIITGSNRQELYMKKIIIK